MNWSEKDLENLKAKGYSVNDIKVVDAEVVKPKKITKISVEKRYIELILTQFKEKGVIDDYVAEHEFLKDRKFRFDWAIPSLMIACEYEGVMSKKSRHTTIGGYSKDIEKYNLAVMNGWVVLRYTALNYKNAQLDLEQLIDMCKDHKNYLP